MSAAVKKTIRVRRWREDDIANIVECQRLAYSDYPDSGMYDARIYQMQLAAFPEGQYLAECDGKVVGYATALIVHVDDDVRYEYNELTGNGTFSSHTPGGDTLYGADIAVVPNMRGMGVAQKLYDARRKLIRRYNLRRMLAFGRLTGFAEHAGTLTAHEYVDSVMRGDLRDPALNAHLRAGYRVAGVSLEIMRDEPSLNWATLLEYENADYDPHKRRIAASPLRRPVRKIRVCAAQYLMRPLADWDAFAQSVRFFAEVTDEYHAHFLVLPELFPAVLTTTQAPSDKRSPIEFMLSFSAQYEDLVRMLAVEYGLYIIGGSIPVEREGFVYNTCYFATPSGNLYTQDKLHVTPSEREAWGIRPGQGLRVFETPLGRIAIQICYDVEFPEVTRLLALAGTEVLFVPFSTDERKAYQRIRVTAQARAVENGIYVVIAGNAGNLPTRNYLLNYARSAVFCPSDFGFPEDALVAEADPNVETVVVADLDLSSLAGWRQGGTVRPLQDRRVDLYQLAGKVPLEIINVE